MEKHEQFINNLKNLEAMISVMLDACHKIQLNNKYDYHNKHKATFDALAVEVTKLMNIMRKNIRG